MDNYCWKVVYNDKTELPQYNDDGSENKYTDINRNKLIQFSLWEKDLDIPVLVIHLDSQKRLIYRRRVALTFDGRKTIVHLVGWQENVEGKNSQMICFAFEDGHIEVVDRFSENHPWFYPINFLDIEKA